VVATTILAVGWYANALRAAGEPWPQWMDGRYGMPLSWGMFADDVDSSIEIVGRVEDASGAVVEVGRPVAAFPGVPEWLWVSADAWHAYAWFRSADVDWVRAARLAADASGVRSARSVQFVIRERISNDSGESRYTDTPLGASIPVEGWDE
jgi:hypothetical protein